MKCVYWPEIVATFIDYKMLDIFMKIWMIFQKYCAPCNWIKTQDRHRWGLTSCQALDKNEYN